MPGIVSCHALRIDILQSKYQVLVTLDYRREYRTFFHMAEDRGVSESTIHPSAYKSLFSNKAQSIDLAL